MAFSKSSSDTSIDAIFLFVDTDLACDAISSIKPTPTCLKIFRDALDENLPDLSLYLTRNFTFLEDTLLGVSYWANVSSIPTTSSKGKLANNMKRDHIMLNVEQWYHSTCGLWIPKNNF